MPMASGGLPSALFSGTPPNEGRGLHLRWVLSPSWGLPGALFVPDAVWSRLRFAGGA